jgi:hypothetical protein
MTRVCLKTTQEEPSRPYSLPGRAKQIKTESDKDRHKINLAYLYLILKRELFLPRFSSVLTGGVHLSEALPSLPPPSEAISGLRSIRAVLNRRKEIELNTDQTGHRFLLKPPIHPCINLHLQKYGEACVCGGGEKMAMA